MANQVKAPLAPPVALAVGFCTPAPCDDVSGSHRKPDFTLAMDGAAWAKPYLNQADLMETVNSGEVKMTQGDQAGAVTRNRPW